MPKPAPLPRQVSDPTPRGFHAIQERLLCAPVDKRSKVDEHRNRLSDRFRRDLKRRLYRDPRSFETLAGTRSKGPEAAVGGYMGTFERGQLPEELEEVAFRLTPGRTSQPVQTSLGYHVLRVDSRQPAREMPLEEARGWIRERLTRERADAAARAFVAGLLSRAKVNHEAAFRSAPSS